MLDSQLFGAPAPDRDASFHAPPAADAAADLARDNKRILVLYTDSGYGHVATARVLRDFLGTERPWRCGA